MEPRIEDYINRPRDTKREQELARELRTLPEANRFEFIQGILAHDLIQGLKLANSCLTSKECFEKLLEQGLQHSDASSIAVWLKCAMPKLGDRRVIHILKTNLTERPEQVEKALYWMPSLINHDRDTLRAYQELVDLAKG